jgi:CysZ protein
MPLPTPPLTRASAIGDALAGLSLPFRALGFIARTPRLLAWSAVSALVTGLTLVGVAVGAWSLGQRGAEWLLGGEGWRHVATVSLGVIFFIALFVAGALTVPNVILAPLQDPISEATEERLGDFTAPPFSLRALARGTVESLWHTLLRVAFMVLGLAVLFPLHFIPGVGSVLWLVLSSVWTMFWLAVEHLSGPMARHLRPFREVVHALRRRPALALGFGAALYAMLWVPVLNFLLLPVAVVAGTLLYRGLLAAGAWDRERST